ncbi:hypothetical protein PG997_006374 [Apiospora hydei]|uniref:Fucose-specific lectin n=1 Tax=Apiospora hydei TaxID=1337664 RepID=A0ABR1WNW1_9PEZI
MASDRTTSPVDKQKHLSEVMSHSSEENNQDHGHLRGHDDAATTQPQLVPQQSQPDDLYALGKLDGDSEKEKTGNPLLSKSRTSRRGNILIISIVGLIVAAGIVVGAVLGVKARRDGANQGNAGNDTARLLLKGSRLAVTGRRIPGDGFNIRLFYQGGDGKIRMSAYENTEATWQPPVTFDSISARNNTPLTAAIDLSYPHFQLYYLNDSSILEGVYLSEDDTSPREDGIGHQPVKVDLSSALTSYWPYLVTQDSDSNFRKFTWNGDTYTNQSMGVNGSIGSSLGLIPAIRQYRSPYPTGLFYRNSSGYLAQHLFGGDDFADAAINNNSIGESNQLRVLVSMLPANSLKANMSIAIPEWSAISVMTSSRKASNLTDTYVLYQDQSHAFFVASQVETNSWNITYLDIADDGSDIACLTEQVGVTESAGSSNVNPDHVWLSSSTDMARCYYQSNNWLREIRLSPTGWDHGPAIPMV